MKKFIVLFMMVLAMMSCADSKTFERADGTKFVAEPYGWANYQSNKIDGVVYEVCAGNIFWGCYHCRNCIYSSMADRVGIVRASVLRRT